MTDKPLYTRDEIAANPGQFEFQKYSPQYDTHTWVNFAELSETLFRQAPLERMVIRHIPMEE